MYPMPDAVFRPKGMLMEASNFDRSLRTFQRQNPFRPFTVALVNGDRFR